MYSEVRYLGRRRAQRRRKQKRTVRRIGKVLLLLLLVVLFFRLAPSLPFLEWNSPIPSTADGDEPLPSDWSDLPRALQDLWQKNPEARSFVEHYSTRGTQSAVIDLSQEAQSDTVPLLLQWDERWGYETYSGGLLGCTGCGPTCLSMAALSLTGNPDYSPKAVAEYATQAGYAVPGSGTAWALISEGSAHFGLTARELPLNESSMTSALEAGELIICVLGPGDFTDSGHFILLTGYADGAFSVNDPNSPLRSEETWTYDTLSGQIKNLWALSA